METQYISIVMLIIYIAVFIWQLNLINTLKSKLQVLEKFQAIFDVKKLEDYVSVINKKHSQDLEFAVHNKVSKEVRDIIETKMGDIPEEFKSQWREAVYFTAATIEEWTEEQQKMFFRSYPLNEDAIRHLWSFRANKIS